jgi:hypothetical protein
MRVLSRSGAPRASAPHVGHTGRPRGKRAQPVEGGTPPGIRVEAEVDRPGELAGEAALQPHGAGRTVELRVLQTPLLALALAEREPSGRRLPRAFATQRRFLD